MKNLAAVIGQASGTAGPAGTRLARLVDLRIYIVRAADAETVRALVNPRCPHVRRMDMSLARLCRPELLVEIEGVAELRLALTAQRDTACGGKTTVCCHLPLDPVQPSKPSADTGAHFEDRARSDCRRKLERAQSRNAQPAGLRDRQPSRLRDELNKNHGRHDGIAGEMSLEIEVVGPRDAPTHRTLAGGDLNNLLYQSHGRLVRQLIDPLHALQYTCPRHPA
jgi:hypothetical protein